MIKSINPKLQETYWTPSIRNMKKTTKFVIIKLLKASDKVKILKQPEEKKDMYRRTKVKMTIDFSTERL